MPRIVVHSYPIPVLGDIGHRHFLGGVQDAGKIIRRAGFQDDALPDIGPPFGGAGGIGVGQVLGDDVETLPLGG